MSDDKGYNGWSNYNTWLCQLWMDNDEQSHNEWLGLAQDVWDNSKPGALTWQTVEQQANYRLGKVLKAQFKEDSPAGSYGFFSDAVDHFLSEVIWSEIAKHWLELVDKGGKCGRNRKT